MIAYDIDGVLIPDCDQIPNIGGLTKFYALTAYMRPTFIPPGNYELITARRAEYRSQTWEWVTRHLGNNMPERVYHECLDQTPSEYKAMVLNSRPDISVYIESELDIVRSLQATVNTSCRIVHYDSWMQATIPRTLV